MGEVETRTPLLTGPWLTSTSKVLKSESWWNVISIEGGRPRWKV